MEPENAVTMLGSVVPNHPTNISRVNVEVQTSPKKLTRQRKEKQTLKNGKRIPMKEEVIKPLDHDAHFLDYKVSERFRRFKKKM